MKKGWIARRRRRRAARGVLARASFVRRLVPGAGRPDLRGPPRPVRAPGHRRREPARGEVGPGRGAAAGRRGRFKLAWMAPDGSEVKKGDVVVRFDPTDLEKKLKDGESDRATAKAKIEKERTETGALLRDREPTAKLSDAELEKTRQVPEQGHAHLLAQPDHRVAGRRAALRRRARPTPSGPRRSRARSRRARSISSRSSSERPRSRSPARTRGSRAMEVTAPHDGIIVFERDWRGEPAQGRRHGLVGPAPGEPPAARRDGGRGVRARGGRRRPRRRACRPTVVLEAEPDVRVHRRRSSRSTASPSRASATCRSTTSRSTLSLERTDPARMKPGQRARVALMLDQPGRARRAAAGRLREGRAEGRLPRSGAASRRRAVKLGASSPGLVVVESGTRTRAIGSRCAIRPRPVEQPARRRSPPQGAP